MKLSCYTVIHDVVILLASREPLLNLVCVCISHAIPFRIYLVWVSYCMMMRFICIHLVWIMINRVSENQLIEVLVFLFFFLYSLLWNSAVTFMVHFRLMLLMPALIGKSWIPTWLCSYSPLLWLLSGSCWVRLAMLIRPFTVRMASVLSLNRYNTLTLVTVVMASTSPLLHATYLLFAV